ncbi:MAG: sulfotransferase [Patescibacteria group bacterium]|nr:MAG: sulfotransferase [Patescibacteria group bacterium]
MITSIKYRLAKTLLRRPVIALRHILVRKEDCVIASYPRSGSTWFGFMLYHLITGRNAQFGEVRKTIPYVGKQLFTAPVLSNGGRIFKTHERYSRVYHNVIYIVRDPRDVAISEYKYLKWENIECGSFDAFLLDFISGQGNQFTSWVDHVESWLPKITNGEINGIVLKFEDLRSDPFKMMKKVVDFMRLDVSDKMIQDAIIDNTLEKMREKEDLARVGFFKRKNTGERFVREGKVGKGVSLSEVHKNLIEGWAGDTMRKLGYV